MKKLLLGITAFLLFSVPAIAGSPVIFNSGCASGIFNLALNQCLATGGGGVVSVTASGFLSSSGGANPNITLSSPVSLLLGGTGQTTASSAFQALLPSLTSGSVLFSNGTTIAQDNAKFFWDDTAFNLKTDGGLFQTHFIDAFSRPTLWAYEVNQTLELGSWGADGLPTNVNSEGIVVYADEQLTSVPISQSHGSYARIKGGRFGLFSVESTLPYYAGGAYWYRVDPTALYYKDNSGNSTFSVQRATGATVVGSLQITSSPTAGFVLTSDASGNGTWQAPPSGGGRTTNTIAAGPFTIPTLTKDYILNVNTTSGSQAVILPDAVGSDSWCVDIKDTGVNTVMISPPGVQTIDGDGSDTIMQWDSSRYCAVDGEWYNY